MGRNTLTHLFTFKLNIVILTTKHKKLNSIHFPFLLPTIITPSNTNCIHICLTLCIGGGGTEVIDGTKEKARSQRSVLMALKVS